MKKEDANMARKETEATLTNLMDFYKRFPDEKSCREYLKNERFPDGKMACPKCGSTDKIYPMADGKRYKCGNKGCFHIFTITVGTIFEASHIPLQKWFLAMYIVSAHKKGISSLQLHRDLGVTQKTAWFMLHRIRYMLSNGLPKEMLDGTVEVDETYVGGKHKGRRGRGSENKTPVFGMVERQGDLRAMPVENVKRATLEPIIEDNIVEGSTVITDELRSYDKLSDEYNHETVNHGAGEYVRGDVYTNTVEGFWSLLKRGIVGIYHYVSSQHLHRYCDEFEYRYNTRKVQDGERFHQVFAKCEGRLKYATLIGK
jgi:transposase-like protein